VGDPGVGLDEPGELPIRKVDRVREDGPRTKATGPVVDIDVVAGLGEQAPDLGDLARVFRDMCLPPGPGPGRERGRLAQHLGRARDGKARRDRVAEAPFVRAVPVGRELLGLAQRALEDRRPLDPIVVGDPIHHHLAEDRPDAVGLGRLEGGIHRGLVDSPVGQDRRRSRGGERPERRGRDSPGVLGIGPALLDREDVALEPGQEVEAGAEPGVRQLRQVGVEVDHARQEDERPQIDRLRVGGRVRLADRRDSPRRIDLDDAVPDVAGPAVGDRRHDGGAQREWRP
jgi:hypothetical protein